MNRLSSRRSQTVELNSNANLKNYEGLNEPQETQELKVCNDCQIRYSHKSSSYSDPGVGKYQPNKLKKTLENDNVLRNSSAISREVPLISPMGDIDLNTKDIQGDSTKSSHSSKVRSSQRFSKERLDSSFDKTNKNRQSNYIKVGDLIDSEYESHRHQINTEKGYIKRVGDALGSLKNKFPIGIQETEYKINQTSSQEDIGEERFIKYAEEFSADLDKVTQRFESNLKKNFENTAHNILHQHLNNQSLLENDDIYKNRESKYLSQRGSSKYSSHNPTKSQRNSGDFSKEHDNHMEYSYISDTQQKKKWNN